MNNDNNELENTDKGKGTNYFTLVLTFCIVMAVVIIALYYLLDYLF